MKQEGGLRTKGKYKKSKKNKPLVTVITVVFNGEEHLEDTIQSVIKQTYDNIEYIIIDGGSTDNTLNIIKKYESYIDYWVSEKDNGIYDAMNKGTRKSTGDLLFFLNSTDCFAENNVVSNAIDFYMKRGFGIIYGDVIRNYKEGKVKLKNKINSEYHLFRKTICHQSMFIPKSLFICVGPYNLNYPLCADREWLLRAYFKKNVKLFYIPHDICVVDPYGVSSQKFKVRKEKIIINWRFFGFKFGFYILLYFFDKLFGKMLKKD